MFSGIIKHIGIVQKTIPIGSNLSFVIESDLSEEMHIDQSISHNGVCLTIESIGENSYQVTAIQETLLKTNLGYLETGKKINLEQCITMNSLLDGHIVQGHTDTTAICIESKEMDGSWQFTFQYPDSFKPLIIEKGSVAVNGVSLTAFNCIENKFSVAIIPYTYHHTNFSELKTGDLVNIEFDILGKYIQRILQSTTV